MLQKNVWSGIWQQDIVSYQNFLFPILEKKKALRVSTPCLSSHKQSMEGYEVHQSPFLFYCVKNKVSFFFYHQFNVSFHNGAGYILNVKFIFRWIFTDSVLKLTIHIPKISSHGISSKLHICLCIYMHVLFSFVVKLVALELCRNSYLFKCILFKYSLFTVLC